MVETNNNCARPLLKHITLHGFLSCGPDAITIPLSALNVFIGPNGSGKSNLVEAFSVLRAAPKDLPLPIRRGGGVKDWLWKGPPAAEKAAIEIVFSEGAVGNGKGTKPAMRYRLVFGAEGGSFIVLDESVANDVPPPDSAEPVVYFGYENGRPVLYSVSGEKRQLNREDLDPTQSILSQRKDPESYPELTKIAWLLGQIRCYRSWPFGPDSVLRQSCGADVPTDALSESFDNLPARLAVLMKNPTVKRNLIDHLQSLSPGFDDLSVVPEGGPLQLYLTDGERTIPARRLSDGTLRYLCLLAILLDLTPPPFIVIEEPELGLHPDMMPILRDLMVEASGRCQILTTTHSTTFVDAFTQYADSVLTCEMNDGASVISRLSQKEVDRLGVEGGLGSLWMSGHIGGTRW